MLEKLKILKEILGSCRISGKETLFCCPRCDHRKKKLSINIEKNVYKCWICNWSSKDITSMIKKYGDQSHLHRWYELNKDYYSIQVDETQPEKVLELPEEFVNVLHPTAVPLKVKAYLKDRGIIRSDCVKWKIGYCQGRLFNNRLIFTSFDKNGDLNFFSGRSLDRGPLKYRNCKSSKDIIYNELMLNWDQDITLVEGPIDAIKAENSVPLLGSTLRENSWLFREICIRKKKVFLALDPDAYTKELEIAKKFLDYGVEVFKVGLSSYEDVGSMTKKEFQKNKLMSKQITGDYLFYNDIFNMELS